jgi:hypothetical protein
VGAQWRRHRLLVGGLLVAVAATIVTWSLWPPKPPDDAPARERHYTANTACLLTDDKGIAAEPAHAAWAGMQEASLKTLIKVQYLAITGPQNAANGLSYFNTLGTQNCAVIIAAGPAPVAAMVEGHARFPRIKHVAIGGEVRDGPVTTVDNSSPATVQAQVREIVAHVA